MKATKILGGVFIVASLCLVLYGNQKVWDAETSFENMKTLKFDPSLLSEEQRNEEKWLEDHPAEWKARFTKEPIAERTKFYWIAAGCFAFGLVLIAIGIDLSSKEKKKAETTAASAGGQSGSKS